MEAPPSFARALIGGILTGLLLGAADWAACGVLATPASLALASALGGALGGACAGILAALLGRPTLGPALVLGGGIALEGLSLASKELTGTSQLVAATLVLATAAIGSGMLSRSLRRNPAAWLGAIALLPLAAWLAASLSASPWIRLAAVGSPLAWLGMMHGRRAKRLGHVLTWCLLLIGLLAAQRGSSPRTRSGPQRDLAAERSEGAGPSIVLLVIDTLRADALDPAGSLAAFGREGVEFRQCLSAAPWTLPSVSSLLTGLLPSQHGAVTAATPLAEDVETMAERLHEQGYATAAFTGGAFVGAGHNLDQGFEVFDSLCERRFAPFGPRLPLVWRLAKNRYLPLRWLVRWVDESVGLAGVLAAARDWATSEPRRPKFLLLHTYQVHDYYLYDPDLDDEVLASRPPSSPRFAGRLSVHPGELSDASQEDLDHFRALYQGRVRAVEDLFPQLVADLSPHIGKDAIWIVTADHGEGFDAAHGRVHHGGRLHDDLLRVPLLVRAPGRLSPGRAVEEPVRSIDVLPTTLALAGLPIPPGLAGESLLPALEGSAPFPASSFGEERSHGYDLVALRRDGWKWIRGPGHQELYHVAEDADEHHPLPHAPPEALKEELLGFPARYPARASPEVDLDEATLSELRALGYVD